MTVLSYLLRLTEPKQQIPEEKKVFSNALLKAMIVPLLIEQLLQMIVGLTDTMMVSHAGEAVVAGVGLDTMIYTIFIYLFTGIIKVEPEIQNEVVIASALIKKLFEKISAHYGPVLIDRSIHHNDRINVAHYEFGNVVNIVIFQILYLHKHHLCMSDFKDRPLIDNLSLIFAMLIIKYDFSHSIKQMKTNIIVLFMKRKRGCPIGNPFVVFLLARRLLLYFVESLSCSICCVQELVSLV